MLKSILAGIAFLVLAAASTAAFASGFCDGYRSGYAQGYCYQEFGCIKPIPPICPIPNIGENSFQDGYNRGFLDGVAAKN